MLRRLLILSALAVLPLPAFAQQQYGSRPLLGPNVGVYFPTNSKAKDAFGSSFVNYGFGIGKLVAPGAAPSIDFNVIANRDIFRGGDKRAIFVPIGFSVSRRLSALPTNQVVETGAVPYAGVSVNVIPNNIRSDKDGINSGWRTAYGGSIYVGVAYQDRYALTARYYLMSSVRGINLSGFNLGAGARF